MVKWVTCDDVECSHKFNGLDFMNDKYILIQDSVIKLTLEQNEQVILQSPLTCLPVLRLFYRQAPFGRQRLGLVRKFAGKTGFLSDRTLAR